MELWKHLSWEKNRLMKCSSYCIASLTLWQYVKRLSVNGEACNPICLHSCCIMAILMGYIWFCQILETLLKHFWHFGRKDFRLYQEELYNIRLVVFKQFICIGVWCRSVTQVKISQVQKTWFPSLVKQEKWWNIRIKIRECMINKPRDCSLHNCL